MPVYASPLWPLAGAVALGMAMAPVLLQPATAAKQDLIARAGGNYVIKPENIKAQFRVLQFGFATVTGKFKSVKGRFSLNPRNPGRSRVDVEIAAGSVTHLDKKVQKFMRGPDLLDAERHPKIRFKSTRVRRTGPTTAQVTGKLTVKGVTRPVNLHVTFHTAGRDPKANNRFVTRFSANGRFNRSDFGINTVQDVVSDEVKFDIEIRGIKR